MESRLLLRGVVCATAVVAILVSSPFANAVEARPNVVMIMTDNHGAWTLGCYGNEDIRTPHIDRLATEGTLFTNAFASNPVCSPTRATVLTGLIPSQHGVHCFLRGGRLQVGPEARCTLDQFTSLPEILKHEGYRCGLVGKWHLGANMSSQEGLDDYWITMPHGGTSTFYDAQIIEDGKLRKEPEYLTDFWTRHAVSFIEQQAEPFFLFLSYNGPYSLSRLLLRDGQNRHAEFYRDKQLPSFPRETTHPWQLHNRDYINNPTSIRRVATEVSGVDDGVGRIMETLEANGLDDNTIVVFLADQGWVGGHGGFFGMGDHTRPVTARDGMMQIPMIWRQPGRIDADKRVDKLVANYDVMPTLLDHLGIKESIQHVSPDAPVSPGKSFAAELTSSDAIAVGNESNGTQADDAVFYEFESLRCIRTHDWKYIHRFPNGPHELYNLKDDPEEFDNLYGRESSEEKASSLRQRLTEFFKTHAAAKYDLWNGGGSQTVIYDGIEEEIAQLEAVAPPELPETFQPQDFTLPEGFSSQLVAGPPLVTHPTMGCFDDQGRLYICNNAGVNMSAAELEEHLPNSINVLQDQDGDGVFDTSTVFADNMTFPMGGAWHDGALYVASPPNIWRLEDTDGDGVADKRDVIVDKFGYTGNAASIHGCFFGPDGRMYWCDGYHGHEFKDEDGNVLSQRKGSYIFSCWPDGSDTRIHCGGGMDNPVELDFTEEGELIGTVNIMYTRPRVDCLVHWQYGGAYPHREAVLEELTVTGDLLGPTYRFGHVAVSGTTRYRSGVMDHRWRDNFFVTQFNLGKVVRMELERSGSTYEATQREFLSCNNRDFHPTDVIEDADGSLLVVDTGGWFYRGCPTSQISKPDILGGIYRIRRDGMTTVPDPRGHKIDWSKRTASQLMQDLKDTRYCVRERAIHECVSRGPEIAAALSRTARSADIVARRNAIWALTRLVAADAYLQDDVAAGPQGSGAHESSADVALLKAMVDNGLADRDPRIRQTVCNAVLALGHEASLEVLQASLDDESPAVRRAAASALAVLRSKDSTLSLLDSLPDAGVGGQSTLDSGRAVEHAILNALIETDAPEDTYRLLSHLSERQQLKGLLAINEMDHQFISSLPEDELRSLFGKLDRQSLGAAMQLWQRYVHRRTDESNAVAESVMIGSISRIIDDEIRLLNRQASSDALDSIQAEAILPVISSTAGETAVAEVIGKWLSAQDLQPDTESLLLNALRSSSGTAVHASWVSPLSQRLSSRQGEQLVKLLSVLTALKSHPFQAQITALIDSDGVDDHVRLSACTAILATNNRPSDHILDLLLQMIRDANPGTSTGAAATLGSSSLNETQLTAVAELLSSTGPQQLLDLVRLFKRSLSPQLAEAFLAGVENARSLNSLPRIEVSEVVKRFPVELHGRANALLDRMQLAEQKKMLKLDALITNLQKGDAVRGHKIFFSEKAKCATCHVVADKGKRVGPDLTTIGANRTAKDLLESIVFPSATIVRQYEPYTLLTVDGRSYSGLVIRDTSVSVTIQQSLGEPVTVSRNDVEELVPATVSIMPKGLDEALTPQQIADLVVWLQSLKKSDR